MTFPSHNHAADSAREKFPRDRSGVPWLILFFVGATVLRLILTGDRDILALNAPYDEYWFIQSARRLVWGGGYHHMAAAHLPVYSLWLAFSYTFGIPARLAIDVAWLLASAYLAFALYRAAGYRWVAVVTFLFLAFHPYALVYFDRALSETLLAVLSTAVLAAGIELWNCRGKNGGRRRAAAGIVFIAGFALAYHTRKEGVVLLAPLVLLALWSWKERSTWWSREGRRRLALPLLVGPLLATIAFGISLAGANYLRWGVFVRYELAAPGYQSAIAALNAIDVGRTPRQVTVTAAARALAYQASPTFRELKPFFEGASGKELAEHSGQFTGVAGEIGNGWFYWALRDAGANAGWHRDARSADAKYRAIAQELHAAFADGRIRKRPFAFLSFVDPDIGKWIDLVPRSVWSEIRLTGWPRPDYVAAPREDASARQYEEFVRIAGRRNARSMPSVAGWMIVPDGTLVGLGPEGGALSWNRVSPTLRPDVPGARPFSVSTGASGQAVFLHARAPDGREGRVALDGLREGQMAGLSGTLAATLGVDELSGANRPNRIERWISAALGRPVSADWVAPLSRVYGWIGYALCLLMAGGAIAALLRREAPSAPVMIFLLAAAAVSARLILLAILDASSWSGMQARYVLPIIPAFVCMGVLGGAIVLDRFRRPGNVSELQYG